MKYPIVKCSNGEIMYMVQVKDIPEAYWKEHDRIWSYIPHQLETIYNLPPSIEKTYESGALRKGSHPPEHTCLLEGKWLNLEESNEWGEVSL